MIYRRTDVYMTSIIDFPLFSYFLRRQKVLRIRKNWTWLGKEKCLVEAEQVREAETKTKMKMTRVRVQRQGYSGPVLLLCCCTDVNRGGWRQTRYFPARVPAQAFKKIYWPICECQIMRYADEDETISEQVRRRRWTWIGHVLRIDDSSLLRVALTWEPEVFHWRSSEISRPPRCWPFCFHSKHTPWRLSEQPRLQSIFKKVVPKWLLFSVFKHAGP